MKDDREELWKLLSAGLDLCVRARKIDAGMLEEQIRNRFPKSAEMYPDHYSRSGTPHLWVQDQYDKDLAEWEEKTRAHLTRHPL